MMLATTDIIRGKTIDDGKEKPATYKFYDYTMGMYVFFFKRIMMPLLNEAGNNITMRSEGGAGEGGGWGGVKGVKGTLTIK
jgi:hypothetical protein